jgi:protein-S-isoprenylcysteine O-methyltransferase Ste14
MKALGLKIGQFIIAHRKSWEYFCNGMLGLLYLLFAWRMLIDFRLTLRTSSLLLAVFETAIIFFSVTRPMPKTSNTSLYDWVVALAGTLIVTLLRPASEVHDEMLVLGAQLFGMTVSLFALFSLNKSFGLVAANRGVKTGGLYGFVRHPIYAGYFLSVGAFVIQNATVVNCAIYASFVVLAILRLTAEERLLSRDPEYIDYARKIRWRVLPFIY